MSFPSIFRRTMGQSVLRVLYNGLFNFEIIIDINFLKCDGQNLRLIYEFVILTKFITYFMLSTNTLRCFQKIWLGPGVDDLLHLLMASVNSALENSDQSSFGLRDFVK